MLFNSYEFIICFLPLTLFGYSIVLKKAGLELAIAFLVLMSLIFYAWWNPAYLILILISMFFNYILGEAIAGAAANGEKSRSKNFLVLGVTINLCALGYYKYANFLVENVNYIVSEPIFLEDIVLPLAISFFTFQQIAYLVDAYKGMAKEYKFLHYALFVTFFPQLIAGPIVHHKEMLPQFLKSKNKYLNSTDIAIGICIFSLGLFKKAVLADGVAQYASPVFMSASAGDTITFFEAWGGALAYTFQLYFDFSGYSDMAIGAARMFGIKLPLNFFSPYKSLSIIEFWRRWHITLSRFLRDYVYIPLGGNRKGKVRRFTNLVITMLLGGLWHGAGWTFVMWGALHGAYLIINHAWHAIKKYSSLGWLDKQPAWRIIAWGMTFLAVVNSWVFFRAENFTAAFEVIKGMYGVNGVSIPNVIYVRLGELKWILQELGITSYLGGGGYFILTYAWITFLIIIVLAMPNTQQIMRRYKPVIKMYETEGYALFDKGVCQNRFVFQFNYFWAILMSVVSTASIFALTSISEFLYFQF